MTDVRRVDLELHVEDERLVLRDMAERELELPVMACFARRSRLDRVDRHTLGPAGAELQDRVLDLLMRGDVKAAFPEEAAAQPGRSVNAERGGRDAGLRGRRPLPEEIEEGENRYHSDERQQQSPDPNVLLAATEVSIAREDDLVGSGHRAGFGADIGAPFQGSVLALPDAPTRPR